MTSVLILRVQIIQGQVITMVMNLVDEVGNWNGAEYVAQHVYAIEYMEGSQLINQITSWDGQRAFDLMSLSLPEPGPLPFRLHPHCDPPLSSNNGSRTR